MMNRMQRRNALAAAVALAAVPIAYAFAVGVVVWLEVRDQHGHAADNLTFDDHAFSKLMSLPLSKVVDLIVPAPRYSDESLGHFELRGFGYVVAAFVDALALVVIAVVVLWGIRRMLRYLMEATG